MTSAGPRAALPPTPMEKVPDPELGSALIPKHRYLSREYADLEGRQLWNRVWLLAGFERDIPNAGDYTTHEVAAESVLVVRQQSGGIRAFHNVCKHRGNLLVEPGRGHASAFVCLYHAWRYAVDGSLEEALDAETFPQGCADASLNLSEVRCDTWGGFVWVNLDPNAAPLRDYLEVIPEHLDPYHFEEMSIANEYTIEIACNWKTCVDAFHESYHIAGTHPDTLDVNDDTDVQYDCFRRHSRMLLKLAVASRRHPEHGQITQAIRDHFLTQAGIDGNAFDGGAEEVRPAMAKSIREVQGPALGVDFSELNDAQLTDDFHYSIFPNVTFNIFGRSAWLFRHRPHPSDPDRMYFDIFNLVRLPNADVPRAEHEFHECTDELRIDLVGGGGDLLAQDTYNLPRIQQGMHSAGFEGLHLGDQELRIRHFHSVLDRYLAAGEA
jgi:phenylpropionate dioxygenase-like ring-hydroxylating dioxygenase large terminal subunit